jgi:DNA-binding CsgD family transcriptional regulator
MSKINSCHKEVKYSHIQLINHKKLTQRERACLHLACLGKTSKQTAIILNLSHHTVDSYRKNIKEKLGCKTIMEAIYKGVSNGHLSMIGGLYNDET